MPSTYFHNQNLPRRSMRRLSFWIHSVDKATLFNTVSRHLRDLRAYQYHYVQADLSDIDDDYILSWDDL